jgi:hypothetical protein
VVDGFRVGPVAPPGRLHTPAFGLVFKDGPIDARCKGNA